MHPPTRTQADIVNQELYSLETGLDASYVRGDPERGTMARQEDRDTTDINTIAARFGLTGQVPQRQIRYGVALDDDVDLQQVFIMRDDAQRAFMQMPADVRKKYGNWHAMLDAIHTGELKVKELPSADPKLETPPADSSATTRDDASSPPATS